MDMLQLYRAAVWIHLKPYKLPFDLDAGRGILNASYMSAYIDHDEGWFSARYGQQVYLADLFRYFRTFEVTDSQDCVYALLGLSGWESRGEALPAFITPDNHSPLGDILRDATKMAMRESGDLWIFRYIEHGYELTAPALQHTETPSWVPSLFRQPDLKTEPNHMRSAFRANLGMKEMTQNIAGKEAGFETSGDLDVLSVQGLVVDAVNAVGRVFPPECFDGVEGIEAIVHKVLISRCLQGGHENEALVRLSLLDLGLDIVGGSSFDPQPMQNHVGQSDIFPQFIQAICKIAGGSQDLKSDYDPAGLKSTLENPNFSRCVWAIKYACLNRRLFTTADGYVGLGPQAMRESDSLCILSDSRLPMILRQSGTDWNVLGPCFAHGVMYGEAVRQRLESGGAVKYFDLR